MDKNKPWGILRLRDMIGWKDAQVQDCLGVWVLAVPLPYKATLWERLVAAWWVLLGRAYAVEWPLPGDLERALGNYQVPKRC